MDYDTEERRRNRKDSVKRKTEQEDFPVQTKEENILHKTGNRERKKSGESWGPLGLLKKKVIFASSKSLEK